MRLLQRRRRVTHQLGVSAGIRPRDISKIVKADGLVLSKSKASRYLRYCEEVGRRVVKYLVRAFQLTGRNLPDADGVIIADGNESLAVGVEYQSGHRLFKAHP